MMKTYQEENESFAETPEWYAIQDDIHQHETDIQEWAASSILVLVATASFLFDMNCI